MRPTPRRPRPDSRRGRTRRGPPRWWPGRDNERYLTRATLLGSASTPSSGRLSSLVRAEQAQSPLSVSGFTRDLHRIDPDKLRVIGAGERKCQRSQVVVDRVLKVLELEDEVRAVDLAPK